MKDQLGETAVLERLFHLSLTMLCIADTEGYFRHVNGAFQKLLGYGFEELYSQPFINFVHPQDRQRTLDEVRAIATGTPTAHFENRYRCRDGSLRWLTWTAMPDDGHELIYAMACDITDYRQADQVLRRK